MLKKSCFCLISVLKFLVSLFLNVFCEEIETINLEFKSQRKILTAL